MTFINDLDRLRGRFRGTLLRPGEEGYDHTRRVWNGAVDRRPALIARCAGADDVATIVRFAREKGLPVSVRGGGHGVTGFAVVDDGVMIDLSQLKAVSVDPARRTVRAGGGMTWGELDLATQRFGLATTGGSISLTGVGGVTLGGGFGHLMRSHGLTVDNLRAAELVTADGGRIRVDADREPELLWGLRGGGGNFGVVTSFEFDLHRVGPIVYGGPVFWPLDQAPLVMRYLRDFAVQAPDELGIAIVANLAPPMPFLPPESYGRPVFGLLLVWSGTISEGIAATAELRSLGTPLAEAVRPVPYRALQSLLDGGAAPGNHAYWRSQRLPDLSDDAIDVICARVESITSPLSLLNGWVLGGAAGRVSPAATAVGDRGTGYELRCVGVWRQGDSDPAKHRAWVLEGWDALRPHSSGRQFASFLSDEGDAGVLAAYGDRLGRLRALKDRWDPTNFFHRNINITPTAGSQQ
jgi:FAD/FMN-containing dehydrogenase